MAKSTTQKTTGVTFQMVEVKTWKGKQDANFRKICKLNEFLVKLEIKRDSYAEQSYAVASVFHRESMEWKKIYSIPYPQLETKEGILYTTGPNRDELTTVPFAKDSETLMAGVTSILF